MRRKIRRLIAAAAAWWSARATDYKAYSAGVNEAPSRAARLRKAAARQVNRSRTYRLALRSVPALALAACSTPLPMFFDPPYSVTELDQALQDLEQVPLPAHRLHDQCQWQPPQVTLTATRTTAIWGCIEDRTIYYLDSLDTLTRRYVLRHEAGHWLDLQRGRTEGQTRRHQGWVCREVTRCSRPFG